MTLKTIPLLALTISLAAFTSNATIAQSKFQQLPIAYDSTEPTDAVARLMKRLEAGETQLSWDPQHGWLPSLLKELNVPIESQNLVFSKTSLQIEHISPSNPRALYFNDDVYVGAVPGAERIELSAVDPQLGAVFYVLDAQAKLLRRSQRARPNEAVDELLPRAPKIVRDQHDCLRCHETGKTKNVPGFLIRSVFPKRSGHPRYDLGTTTTDHSTPLEDRFGGWYVTGSHGKLRHRGNVIATGQAKDPIDAEAGANLAGVPTKVRSTKYLYPKSDIVALMVLEHQSQMHNLITRAGFETRTAEHYQQVLNRALDREPDFVSESTKRRITKVGDELVAYMLFANETLLDDTIVGDPAFVAAFQKSAVRDSQGRSLRDFDLQRRMLRHSCSYLIYSEAFEALPTTVRDYIENRIVEVLSGDAETEGCKSLTADEQTATLEILAETYPRIGQLVREQTK